MIDKKCRKKKIHFISECGLLFIFIILFVYDALVGKNLDA